MPAGSQDDDSGPPGSLLAPGDSPALAAGSFTALSQGCAAALTVQPQSHSSQRQGSFPGVCVGDFTWSGALGDGSHSSSSPAFPHFTLKCHGVVSKAQDGAWDAPGLSSDEDLGSNPNSSSQKLCAPRVSTPNTSSV